MDFVKLFLRMLEEVAELLPEQERIGGFKIYSSDDGFVRIPVISTKAEFDLLFDTYHPKLKEYYAKNLENRLVVIISYAISIMQEKGSKEKFPNQIVINPNALPNMIRSYEKELRSCQFKIKKFRFIEANLVAYVCHELRHLVQIYTLNPADFLSIFHLIPSFTNNLIEHKKLRRYWFWENKYQLHLYKNHYSNHPSYKYFIAIEKDAMYIQMLVFDCWIDSKLSYREKILKLQKLLKLHIIKSSG